jgi:hypothetical protein
MKFVLVNGRTPSLVSTCTWCCDPIGETYLRELPTRLPYCDHRCYFAHLQSLEDFRVAKAGARTAIKNRSRTLPRSSR